MVCCFEFVVLLVSSGCLLYVRLFGLVSGFVVCGLVLFALLCFCFTVCMLLLFVVASICSGSDYSELLIYLV